MKYDKLSKISDGSKNKAINVKDKKIADSKTQSVLDEFIKSPFKTEKTKVPAKVDSKLKDAYKISDSEAERVFKLPRKEKRIFISKLPGISAKRIVLDKLKSIADSENVKKDTEELQKILDSTDDIETLKEKLAEARNKVAETKPKTWNYESAMAKVRVIEKKIKELEKVTDSEEEENEDEEDAVVSRIDLINVKNLVDNYVVTPDQFNQESLEDYIEDTETLPQILIDVVHSLLNKEDIDSEKKEALVKLYQDNNLRSPIFSFKTTNTEPIKDDMLEKIVKSDFIDPVTGEEVSLDDEENLLGNFMNVLQHYVLTGEVEPLQALVEENTANSDDSEEENEEESEEEENEDEENITDSLIKIASHLIGKTKLKEDKFLSLCDSVSKTIKLPFNYRKGTLAKPITDSFNANVSGLQAPMNRNEYYTLIGDSKNKIINKLTKKIYDDSCPPIVSTEIVGSQIIITIGNGETQVWEPLNTEMVLGTDDLNFETSQELTEWIGDNCIPSGGKQVLSAQMNELGIIDNSFYKKRLSDNFWYADEVPSLIPDVYINNNLTRESSIIVSPEIMAEEEQFSKGIQIEILGEPYFLYLVKAVQ